MKTKALLEFADISKMLDAGLAEADRQGWCVTIAVVSSGGHLLGLRRMDGAPPMSAVVAPEKARTCVLSLRPSKAFEDMVNKGRTAALSMPVVPLEGGEMVVVDGRCIAAVGVSGAAAGEDAAVARAAVAAMAAVGATTTF